jgi:predicted CxxxxCH...CXXCH cytochrome family protein
MKKPLIVLGIALAFSLSGGPAQSAGLSHAEYVKQYKGTATCTAASCHEGAAKEVAESLHYQQRAVPQFLESWEAGKFAGMMESY